MTQPVFCAYYKFLLVEELVLTFPGEFHYGNCSAIGTFSLDPENNIYLNNVEIEGIPSKYRLESHELKLKTSWSICDQIPVYDQPVQVYGEAVMFHKAAPDRSMEGRLPANARDAYEEVNSLSEENKDSFWARISEEYQPGIKVHSYRPVTQHQKLIGCNLRMRVFSEENEGR